jgi:hypothetical protein
LEQCDAVERSDETMLTDVYKCCLQALAEATENLEKHKQQTETLMNKQSVMQQEKEMLNEQWLENEKGHRETLARLHTVLLTQKSEIDAARVKEEALQGAMRQLEKKVSELQSTSDGWWSKEQYFLSQLMLAQKREGQCSAILDRTSNKFLVTGLAKPMFTEWKDLACDARARRWTLHGIMGGWHRRFRKNHFLQWKFYTKTVKGFCDSKVAIIRLQVLAAVFQAWAALPHMSAQERREMELKTEADAAKTAADNAMKASMEKSASKLAALANELRVSRQHLYEAEQDKEAIRAKAAQDTTEAVKTLERELQQSAEKEKQLKRDFQSQLAVKFSEEQVAERLSEVKQQLSEEHMAKMSELEKKYNAAASIASQTHSVELDKLDKIRQELEHQHSRRISALESQHQDAMHKAAQAYSMEIEKLTSLQEDQEQQHKIALAGAQGQHKAALDSTLEAERKAFYSTKSELEKQLQALNEQLANALEERKATEDRSRSTVMELENKIKVEVAKLHFKLQEREAQLNDELQRTQVASSKVIPCAPLFAG